MEHGVRVREDHTDHHAAAGAQHDHGGRPPVEPDEGALRAEIGLRLGLGLGLGSGLGLGLGSARVTVRVRVRVRVRVGVRVRARAGVRLRLRLRLRAPPCLRAEGLGICEGHERAGERQREEGELQVAHPERRATRAVLEW